MSRLSTVLFALLRNVKPLRPSLPQLADTVTAAHVDMASDALVWVGVHQGRRRK